VSNKPTLQAGTTTWAAMTKTRCYCRHIMANHQIWANKIVCLEQACHGIRPEDIPEGQSAVKQCWDYDELDVRAAAPEDAE
jgi:hypothetical protein